MKYKEIESLEKYLAGVERSLLSEANKYKVSYPKANISPWDSIALDKINNQLLSNASSNANVYAIFTASKGSDTFLLRYIGKTTRKLARQRIRNHLIKKNEGTGAKLLQVTKHVLAGGEVMLSWVKVEPESLRNYLEEELIARHREADWNRENQ